MKQFILSALLLTSSALMADDHLIYHKCTDGTQEIKSIKEVHYNKSSKRLEIIKSDRLVTKAVSNLGGIKLSNYLLSGDLKGRIHVKKKGILNGAVNGSLDIYKLSLDEGAINDKIRQSYGEDLDISMLIAVQSVNRDLITLKRGAGYNLYLNHGNLRSILEEDMIKETSGSSVRIIEELWRVSPDTQAYANYSKSLSKGKLSNGVMDEETHRIHIEKSIKYDVNEFSCQLK